MAISAEDKNFLVSLYVGYFNRAPDPAGLQFWIDQVEAGRDTNTIAADFAASPEAKSLYLFLTTPDVSSPTSFITAVYANLFNRAPDAAGQAFWEAQLSSGAVSPADAIDAIIKGATTAPDATILANKNIVGLDFATDAGNTPGFTFDLDGTSGSAAKDAISGVTEDSATVTAAQTATDAYLSGVANIGQTFTLTTGVDNVSGTAGNDSFIGSTATLQSGDVITGGSGVDVLSFVDSAGAATSVLPTLTGVETVQVTSAGTDVTLNLVNSTGLTKIASKGSSEEIVVNNISSLLDLEVSSATTANSDVTLTYSAAAVAGSSDTQNVALSSNGSSATSMGTIDVDGVETIAVTATGANFVTAITGNASLASVTFAGAGSVEVDTALATTVETVNAASNTGGVSVELGAANVTFTGGTGADTVNAGGTLTADDALDGGDGTDTLRVNDEDQLTTAGLAVAKNFEVLQTDLVNAAATLDVDNISGVTSFIIGDGATQTDRMQANLTIDDAVSGSAVTLDAVQNADDTLTFDLKTDGSTDTLRLNLRNTEATASTGTLGAAAFVADDIETLTVNTSKISSASATGNTMSLATFTATDMTKLVITGDQSLALGATATTGNTNLAEVDASAATGDTDLGAVGTAFVTANTGATFTMGSGDDVVSLDVGAGGVLKAVAMGTNAAVNTTTTATGDLLALSSAAGTGLTIVDLTSTTDQIQQLLGSANSGAQTGIEHINLGGFAAGGASTQITGTSGNNVIVGTAAGQDIVNAGAGDDTIDTQAGTASITTGAGADRVVVGEDDLITITDFTVGSGNDIAVIDLSEALAGTASADGDFSLLGDGANIADGATGSLVTADGATDISASTGNILVVSGTFATAALAGASLEATGANVLTTDLADNENFFMLYTDGTNSYLATVEHNEGADDTDFEAGNLTEENIVQFSGITDLSTFNGANFLFQT